MQRWQTSNRFIGIFFAVAALAGLLASYQLGVESLELAKDPSYNPACNISPILSCSKVMASSYSSFLGIPNPYLGLMGFSALLTVGAMIYFGVRLPKRVWVLAHGAALAGMFFVVWLFTASLMVIGSICPWCSLLWVATIAVFWIVHVHIAALGVYDQYAWTKPASAFIKKYAGPLLIVLYLVFAVAVFIRFSDYWMSLLG